LIHFYKSFRQKKMDISEFTDNNHKNLELFSEIPDVCKSEPCLLGVDEAGRGPVLGPMVYGICFCPISRNEDLKQLGVDDSKALTEEQRDKLLDKVLDNNSYLGWGINILSPRYISNSMYRRGKYNLNSMSHDTAIGLIQSALDKGVNVKEVYVDTVGPPEKYQAKLEKIFPGIKIRVEKKADSLFPCVSAASICAKVSRDRALSSWKLAEADSKSKTPWGSGYPGDAVTKKFLQSEFHPVFAFPSIVRFSWKTAEKIVDEKGVEVNFEDVEPEDENPNGGNTMKDYFVSHTNKTKPEKVMRVHPYFRERCLAPLSLL